MIDILFLSTLSLWVCIPITDHPTILIHCFLLLLHPSWIHVPLKRHHWIWMELVFILVFLFLVPLSVPTLPLLNSFLFRSILQYKMIFTSLFGMILSISLLFVIILLLLLIPLLFQLPDHSFHFLTTYYYYYYCYCYCYC